MGIEILEGLHEEPWREALALRPGALIFQWPEMHRVWEAATGVEPGALIAMDSTTGRGLACMAWETIRPTGWAARYLLTRAICHGGPVFDPASERSRAAAQAVVERHLELVRPTVVYSQFRNAYPETHIGDVVADLAVAEPHCNFIIDLSPGAAAVFAGMSGNRRKGIRRAERDGLSVRRVTESAEVDACYALFAETYARVRLPLADRSLFESAFRLLGARARFYLAECDGNPLAARAMLLTDETIYDWYAGSTLEGDNRCAGELIVWQALQDACALGLRRFDFGGGGNPLQPYGPREFKRRFGGASVFYNRYNVPMAPVRCGLAACARQLRNRLVGARPRGLLARPSYGVASEARSELTGPPSG